MLNVFIENQRAGDLFKSELKQGLFFFKYDSQCPSQNAVSLTMPVVSDPYLHDYKHQLHPIFDMNLPEGELGKHLRRQFSKVVPNFDDLAFLKIIGQHQIGRLRFNSMAHKPVDVPAQSVKELIAYDGAEGLFESLLDRYAVYSGISGVQPKVMIRDSDDSGISRITHRDATHIVKAWNPGEYPQLAANEYFCMRAALHSKLEVPKFELSDNGKFLIVERFDVGADSDSYLGFEDFCVLNGNTSELRYESSYENMTKRIKEFVSTEQLPTALESFFKTLALSCAVKNGDAHLKNFGVLYANTESTVRLSPAYDIVSTTPYIPGDMIALTLGGSKAWPKEKALVKFARQHCNMTDSHAKAVMGEVAEGMVKASHEMVDYIRHNDFFRSVGEAMLAEWNKGLSLSLMAENRTTYSTAKSNAAKKHINAIFAANMLTDQRVDLGRIASSVDDNDRKEIEKDDLEHE